MRFSALQSDLLRYIVENGYKPGDRLPTIQEISQALGVSIAKTREDLEIARALGIVEVKPGRGTRVAKYRFEPLVTLSALYAIGQDQANFEQLRQMRNALEVAFWNEAVSHLGREDIAGLRNLIASARTRLASQPVQVPAAEHRTFHLTIFSRLNNLFVQGVLEAFWEVYEAFGLNLYYEIDYHRKVWDYHEQIVNTLEAGQIETGRRLLVEHMNLLEHRDRPGSRAATASNQQSSRFE